MNEENIDDDALLSGLPSWKDSFQPVKRPSEKLVTEKGFEQAQTKPQPKVSKSRITNILSAYNVPEEA
ncbi:hypothetical protein MEQU1_001284 [Malassezia equina]|uniref:Uncharacterized protein n=1 Tax=Malassezia equina TaxID=1381935 RepID=A0AAF0IYS8_9BASI|nr:hypothetical protein MEQU1_001284 [Malassezia equina]